MIIESMINEIMKHGFSKDKAIELTYDYIKLCNKHKFNVSKETIALFSQMCEVGLKKDKKETMQQNEDER